MSDRSGCGEVELGVLQSLAELTGDDRDGFVSCATVTATMEKRLGLGPRYGCQVLLDLARPWVTAMPLVAAMGDIGGRTFPEPADSRSTESRQSHVGQLVLDAESGRLPPVPVGLINGTVYRDGVQPALEPFAAIAALRTLLGNADAADAEIISIAGPPYSPAGCQVDGDLCALIDGREAAMRETARIIITGVPVPQASPPQSAAPGTGTSGPAVGGWTAFRTGHAFPSAHLRIESLPYGTLTGDVASQISERASPRERDDSPTQRALAEFEARMSLPVASVADESEPFPTDDRPEPFPVSIGLRLRPGSDPEAVRQQLMTVDGMSRRASWAFPSALAVMLRSWVERHHGEDLAATLAVLEQAIIRDREWELDRS